MGESEQPAGALPVVDRDGDRADLPLGLELRERVDRPRGPRRAGSQPEEVERVDVVGAQRAQEPLGAATHVAGEETEARPRGERERVASLAKRLAKRLAQVAGAPAGPEDVVHPALEGALEPGRVDAVVACEAESEDGPPQDRDQATGERGVGHVFLQAV